MPSTQRACQETVSLNRTLEQEGLEIDGEFRTGPLRGLGGEPTSEMVLKGE